MEDLQTTILHQIRVSNFDHTFLTNWATELVHNFANFKAQHMDKLVREDSENILNIAGLGNSGLRQARGEKNLSPIL